MKFSLFRPKPYVPRFPIVPLYIPDADAVEILSKIADVTTQDPEEGDKTIAQTMLVAKTDEARISVGIFDGMVRYTNYLTDHFDRTEKQRAAKLAYFVQYYGGVEEFEEPADTGMMIWWRNPVRKILILFGLHCGPVRVIDEDPGHWQR